MEREIGNMLAIRQDLLLVKHELVTMRQDLRQEFQLLQQEMQSGFRLMHEKIDRLRSDMSGELAAHRQSIVFQLGSLIVACFGLTLAAMRFWS